MIQGGSVHAWLLSIGEDELHWAISEEPISSLIEQYQNVMTDVSVTNKDFRQSAQLMELSHTSHLAMPGVLK